VESLNLRLAELRAAEASVSIQNEITYLELLCRVKESHG